MIKLDNPTVAAESNTDRELVVLEQTDTHHSVSAMSNRGFIAWTAVPGDDNRWMGCDFRADQNSATSNVNMSLWEQFHCEFRAGTIATRNEDTRISYPDGGWSEAWTQGWNRMHSFGTTRRIRYTPNTGEKYVWLLGFADAGNGTATVSVSGATGVVEKATVDFRVTGDWAGTRSIIGEGGGAWVLIASFPAGATGTEYVQLEPDSADLSYVHAFLSCSDVQATPATGVYYPPSMGRIGRSEQVAPAPRYFKAGDAGAPFFMDDGHITVTELPVSESILVVTGDGTAADFTDNTRTITSTTGITAKWECTWRKVDGGNQDIATHQQIIEVSPGGIITMSQRTVVTAAGEAYDLRIAAENNIYGGYCGQWGVDDAFSLGRVRDGAWTEVAAPWDGSLVCDANASEWEMHNNSDLLISITATGTVLSGATIHTSAGGKIIKRAEGFGKIYRQLCDSEVNLAEGDVIATRQLRRVQVRNSRDRAVW